MDSTCPFCHISLPLSELEWHANNHFLQDDLISDMELAKQIFLAPESMASKENFTDFIVQSEDCSLNHNLSTSVSTTSNCSERTDVKMSISLVKIKKPATFYKVEGGIMNILAGCLEKESKYTSVVTGYIDHYESAPGDIGWGCGWRNIQMLSSHLVAEREEVRNSIFNGCEFIPDILSLQGWLEVAWERGFDIPGAKSFDTKVYGSKKWIGATECAALLRSFGLRARVVDFDSKSAVSMSKSAEKSLKRTVGDKEKSKIYGPMDKYLTVKRQDCSVSQNESVPIVHGFSNVSANSNIGEQRDESITKIGGPQILANWVWNYFTEANSYGSTSYQNVLITKRTPLYFQHDGHSRTIVGIQRLKRFSGMLDQYTLLILDPGQRTIALEKALKGNSGWQRFIKRGVHTLRKSQYQLCYIDPGIASGEELNQLKTIESLLVKM